MADWQASVPRSKDAAEMRATVPTQYPGVRMEFTLNNQVATYFPATRGAKHSCHGCARYGEAATAAGLVFHQERAVD